MEKITLELENLLDQKLSLYRRLNELLESERTFIVDINIDALWKSAEEKKNTVKQIMALREEILAWFESHFRRVEMSASTFSLAHLIRLLPVPENKKDRIREIKRSIRTEKEQLEQSGRENRRYVSEYLSVIDEIMGAVADNSRESGYNHSGRVSGEKMPNRLISAEV